MAVERLEQVLDLEGGQRFFFLCGPGVNDRFIIRDYAEVDIEQALWLALRAQGFQCIVFSAADRPLYFLDEDSRRLALPSQEAPQRSSAQRMSRLRGGSLGDRMLLFRGGGVATTVWTDAGRGAGEVERFSRAIGDVHALQLLNALMRRDQPKTAVIFCGADILLEFF